MRRITLISWCRTNHHNDSQLRPLQSNHCINNNSNEWRQTWWRPHIVQYIWFRSASGRWTRCTKRVPKLMRIKIGSRKNRWTIEVSLCISLVQRHTRREKRPTHPPPSLPFRPPLSPLLPPLLPPPLPPPLPPLPPSPLLLLHQVFNWVFPDSIGT